MMKMPQAQQQLKPCKRFDRSLQPVLCRSQVEGKRRKGVSTKRDVKRSRRGEESALAAHTFMEREESKRKD